jgi:alpha-mannosidase
MNFKLYKGFLHALLLIVACFVLSGGICSNRLLYRWLPWRHLGALSRLEYPFYGRYAEEKPNWKINIELEPETWARAMAVDPAAYADFKALFADQSLNGRIEYVNPAYAQSYNYNISGESIIGSLVTV